VNKERHILRQDWGRLPTEIEAIVRDKNISQTHFRRLGVHEDWKTIEDNIYHTFCNLNHPVSRPIWLWERFKLDTEAIATDKPDNLLSDLIDHDETIWFFLNGDKDKLWFYEGKIKSIMTVVEESKYIDELYLASKKYTWLILYKSPQQFNSHR